MANLEKIKQDIQNEFHNPTKSLSHVEFNRRGQEVVMTYVYFSETHEHKEPHLAPHDKDPEWLTIEEMNTLKKYLDDHHWSFHERTDIFI